MYGWLGVGELRRVKQLEDEKTAGRGPEPEQAYPAGYSGEKAPTPGRPLEIVAHVQACHSVGIDAFTREALAINEPGYQGREPLVALIPASVAHEPP